MSRRPEIGVVHLVRAQNGIAPFRRFLDAYAANPGGLDHQLLLVYKGFGGTEELAPYERLAADYQPLILRVSDRGFDIAAYYAAARAFPHRFLCFHNSFSLPLDPDWLAKLAGYIGRPEVGAVGASGSWGSIATHFAGLWAERSGQPLPRRAVLLWRRLRYRAYFPPFPNYHLRTNAFLISRELLLRIPQPRLVRKLDAQRFESGNCSLTQQLSERGLRALVVGRDGRCYEKEEWDRSNCFWQGEQANLLVADNRTEQYASADPAFRAELSRFAWADRARPAAKTAEPAAAVACRSGSAP